MTRSPAPVTTGEPAKAARPTKAQRTVVALLEGEPAFLPAQEVHARLRASGASIGLTSVYRALQVLADEGRVDVSRTPSGELAYRLCATVRHHHHLTCRRCGATVEVQAPAIERWIVSVAETHGYRPDSHTVEILGTCNSCRGDEPGPSAPR